MKQLCVLLLFVAVALGQSHKHSTSMEFLQVTLGQPLAAQFPECTEYNALTEQGRDKQNPHFHCYARDYVFDHDTPYYPGTVRTADEYEQEYKLAIHTHPESDTGNVGYVSNSYPMDDFQDTLTALKSKRGVPVCSKGQVQNLMGARLTQIHCEWKQPWGTICLTAPSDDDVTMLDVWALTNHYVALRAIENKNTRSERTKDF